LLSDAARKQALMSQLYAIKRLEAILDYTTQELAVLLKRQKARPDPLFFFWKLEEKRQEQMKLVGV